MQRSGLFPYVCFCKLVAGILILIVFAPHIIAQSSQGPLNPGTFSNNNTTCPFAYSSTVHLAPAGNSATSNNSYSSASHCDCCDTHTSCLYATNYGFTIPAGAVITGIQVDVERRRSAGAGGYIEDNGVMLIKGGTPTGSNRANYGVNWPTTDAYVTYGGSSDLWGTTWTVAEINASNFGVAFACISYTCGSAMTSFVDHIRITVYYNTTLPENLHDFVLGETQNKIQISWRNDNPDLFTSLEMRAGDHPGELRNHSVLPADATEFETALPAEPLVYFQLVGYDVTGQEYAFPLLEYRKAVKTHVSWQPVSGGILLILPAEAREGDGAVVSVVTGSQLVKKEFAAGQIRQLIPLEDYHGKLLLLEIKSAAHPARLLIRPE